MDRNTTLKLVKASGVTDGELVLVHFWGEDCDRQAANDFMTAVASLHATPVLLQQARSVNRDMFSHADEGCFDERYFDLFSRFDAVLDVFAYQPVVLGYEIGEEPMKRYRNYMSRLFSSLMKSSRFTQIRLPTAENALEAGLCAEDYIRRMTNAYDIDYDALKHACKEKLAQLQGLDKPVLVSGDGAELEFDLSGREWHVDAGGGDLPCGEVYIAPWEEKTCGKIFYETLYIEDVGKYENVTLYAENGRITGSDREEVTQFFRGLPLEDTVVCELGLGLNPNVSDLCGYTVLDEKMMGTFHIAIGENRMFGGANKAGLHMDFVGKGRIRGL